MTICRYFLQGTCRFGDRCRFEHTENNAYYSSNKKNYDRYSRQEEFNNYRYENEYENRKYDVNNRHTTYPRSYSSDRYSDYRNASPERYSNTYSNQYRKYDQGYEQQTRYNTNRGSGHHSNYKQENNYGQNRFRWLSEDYVQSHQQNENKRNMDETYSTSTPKGKVSFSFKVPESEIKKESGFSVYKVDEQDQLHAELVKEDAKAWELGGQWPFSCYFPCSSKCGFPGFSDISPEELRYAAYKSEENNLYDSYVKSVQEKLQQISQLRSQLQIPTPQLIATLKRIWDGENLCISSLPSASIPFVQSENMVTDIMDAPTSMQPNSALDFSFKMPVENDLANKTVTSESVKSLASSFSFKVTSASESKSNVPVSNGDPDIYTPIEDLTEEEKEQFSASTFVLGKIPTRPPSYSYCV